MESDKKIYEALEKSLYDIVINKRPNRIDVINTIDSNGSFIDISVSDLEVGDFLFTTEYGKVTMLANTEKIQSQTISANLLNWLIGMLNFLKEKKLLEEFKNFYEPK